MSFGLGVQLTDFDIVLCWSADGQRLVIYSNEEFYKKTLLSVILKITVAWGWSMFFADDERDHIQDHVA